MSQRILVAGPLVGPRNTGPGVYLSELLRAMLAIRPELSVVSRLNSVRGRAANRASAALIDPRMQARTVPVPGRIMRSVQVGFRLPPEGLLSGRYDVYHQFHTDANPVVPSSRLVVTLHDTVALRWPREEGAMYRGAGSVLRRAAAVITGSEHSKASMCDAFGVAPDNVHVIPYGVRAERFAVPASNGAAPDSIPYLLYFGGHTPRKNLTRLIQALALVREVPEFADLRLVIGGPASVREQELRARAPTGLPHEALVFPGYVSQDQAVGLYQHAAAFAFPSLEEGFGLPILEAMAAGTPVVASAGSSLREVGGSVAEYVVAEDQSSIAAGIVSILREDANAHVSRVAAGRARAAEFTWERCARGVLAVYDGLGG